MVVFEGISVQVLSTSGLVPEYPDPVGVKGPRINRYIEAELGTGFGVAVHCGGQNFEEATGIVCTLSIDGIAVDRAIFIGKDDQPGFVFIRRRGNTPREFKNVHCDYLFSYAADCSDVETSTREMGTIALKFQRIGRITKSNIDKPERWVKGINIVPILGLPKSGKATRFYQHGFQWIDRQDKPFFTLKFLYRSREALQELQIIPPPPPPTPLEDRSLETLSRDELIQLCQMYKQRSCCEREHKAKHEPSTPPRRAKRKREEDHTPPGEDKVSTKRRRKRANAQDIPNILLYSLSYERHFQAGTLASGAKIAE